MGKLIDADKLKEEIAKEPVWAALAVTDIIDKMIEETEKENGNNERYDS